MIPHAIHAFRADTEKGGLVFHGDIIGDGKLHRTGTANKPKGLDGACVLHLDTPASGWWKNFCTGESGTWTAGDSKRLTPRSATGSRLGLLPTGKAARRKLPEEMPKPGRKRGASCP